MTGMIAISCRQKESASQNTPTASNQNLEEEILRVHDEVMPKMSDINRLSNQLREIKKNAGQTPDGQPITIEGLDETLKELRTAEQGMSDWMKNYGDTKANLKDENLKDFYEKELKKIRIVRDNMLSSIEKANAWLAAHPAG